ncbi:peptidoglycan editing factor PgeF [Dysgonomonas sp. ZJ709]|uniref:peptidoglycan editing factor PgeF n=1 Tax=Dysgonomonas sp. ZJ709 TaxID=2709797 RepID=UPI0013EE2DD8|nr:peptidoglycan editing factor PgeF [Dysgonomonas sp. ZJ709]
MEQINKNGIELLQFSSFPSENICHFSTTIHGGISKDAYSTLNLSLYSGDNCEDVYENRGRLAKVLNVLPENVFIPYQTHGDKILDINQSFLDLSDEEKQQKLNGVDAIITNKKHIGIGITTADCVPLLIFDPDKEILATIHAGWKGTVARIAAKTGEKMIADYGCSPCELLVGIAPSISPDCFEVGDEVGEAFILGGFNLSTISYRNAETNKLHINLWEANKIQLLEIGILSQNIEVAELCTLSNPNMFFSARRQTINSGRMLTGGVIK